MDAYIYQADMWCAGCGERIRREITEQGGAPANPEDEAAYDSGDFPKGPYDDGGGESDAPSNCAGCGVFLENPLTAEGYEYLRGMLLEGVESGGVWSGPLEEWAGFYGASIEVRLECDRGGSWGRREPCARLMFR